MSNNNHAEIQPYKAYDEFLLHEAYRYGERTYHMNIPRADAAKLVEEQKREAFLAGYDAERRLEEHECASECASRFEDSCNN